MMKGNAALEAIAILRERWVEPLWGSVSRLEEVNEKYI